MIERVFIDSDVEQHAFLVARLGDGTTWQSISQTMRTGPDGAMQELLELQRSNGETVTFAFEEATHDPSLEGEGIDRTTLIDDLTEKAAGYAADNPPHHPGSLPRLPVPIHGYGRAVAVPMPILAADDAGRPGLHAPPRYVVVSWPDAAFVGIGEFPGFKPDNWPPARLGDWPPVRLAQATPDVLLGMIGRFSACWSRVMTAWFDAPANRTDVIRADVREATALRAALEVPGFPRLVDALNPAFAHWLDDMAEPPAAD